MKRILAIILSVVLLVSLAPSVSMAATVKYKTTKKTAMKKAYKSSKTIVSVPKGKQVIYKSSKTYKKVKWYYVQYGKKKGYIKSKYLKKIQKQTATKGPKPAPYSVIKAKNFPNDGWNWRRNTYAWVPSMTSWDENGNLEDITWKVMSTLEKGRYGAYLASDSVVNNAKKFLGPKPTFEQSKKFVKEEGPFFINKYGEVTLYVFLND